MRRLLATILLVAACGGPPPAERAAPAVPGVTTQAARTENVRDTVVAFGFVAADAVPPEVRDARAQLVEAEARRALARETVQRLEALAHGAVVPRKELEAARAEEATATALVERARQVMRAFGPGVPSAAPAAGATWLLAHVVEQDVARIHAGAEAVFVPDAARDRRLPATVDADPAYVDTATTTAPVRLRLRTADGLLRPGMTGTVTIHPGAPRSAVVVPESAVVHDGGRTVVLVEAGGARWEPRPVTPGVRAEGTVEIVAGLAAGERVATTGAASLLSAARLPADAAGH
jgi:hypothetical protein